MSKDTVSKDIRLFDLRSVEKNIQNGLITKAEYKKYLASLPDDSGNFESVLMEEESDVVILGENDDVNSPS